MRRSALLLAALLLLPSLGGFPLLARGGGGGRGGFGGGDWQRGYGGYHPMYGDGVRPGVNGDAFDRQVNVNNNFYNRDCNGWNSAWRNGGYWGNRPWGALPVR